MNYQTNKNTFMKFRLYDIILAAEADAFPD